MSFWSTKSDNRERNYVVIKHKIKGINYTINGVRFRDGWAVVEKNSKTYSMLKKMPLLHKAKENPLLFLKDLKFITRVSDVKTVYGADVYKKFMKQLIEYQVEQKEQKELKQTEEINKQEEFHIHKLKKCKFRAARGNLCKLDALKESPSGYCNIHILRDPLLEEYGINIPMAIARDEKKKWKNKVIKWLKEKGF